MKRHDIEKGAQVSGQELAAWLDAHPVLKARIVGLTGLVENAEAIVLADDAERQVMEGLRSLGNELLTSWAQRRVAQTEQESVAPQVTKHQKKLCWHSTYGQIEISEQTYWDRPNRHVIRPFSVSAGVRHRSYSWLLEKAITDFGASTPFAKVAEKVKRHYGIDLGRSAAYTITSRHAKAMAEGGVLPQARTEAPRLIAEMDGSMVPVVQMAATETQTDLRKTRAVCWKELKLGLVRRDGEIKPLFGATMGPAEDAGALLKKVAQAAGLTPKTRVHAVGDGATWLRDQVECQFGAQSTYLVDFYHGCEYLAAASKICCPLQTETWMEQQKTRLKTNQAKAVLQALAPYREAVDTPDDDAPVRACYRYFVNRLDQLDYQGAIASNLPIGSGEIESAHRYIVQDRIKRPGAWWNPEKASNIVALRIADENGVWDQYWDSHATA